MRNGNLELMNRRNVLSMLGAAGIYGIAGSRGFGQGRQADSEKEQGLKWRPVLGAKK